MEKNYKNTSLVRHVLEDGSEFIAYVGTDLNDAANFVERNSASIPKTERYDIYYRCEEIQS